MKLLCYVVTVIACIIVFTPLILLITKALGNILGLIVIAGLVLGGIAIYEDKK